MSYTNVEPALQNLVFLGGMMNVKPEWMSGLIENFRDQVQSVREIYANQGGNPDDLNFVVGFNSPASVRLTNIARRKLKTDEGDIILHMCGEDRRLAFSNMANVIGACGIIEFDQEKLGELFVDYAAEGQPFVGIAKRGYGPDGADDLPVCEGMAWIKENGGNPITLPAWEAKPVPETASTHSA